MADKNAARLFNGKLNEDVLPDRLDPATLASSFEPAGLSEETRAEFLTLLAGTSIDGGSASTDYSDLILLDGGGADD